MWVRSYQIALLAGVAWLGTVAPGVAGDIEALARLLTPAYMTQDFAAICTAAKPGFLSGIPNPSGYTAAYAQHVRGEVLAGLPRSDSMSVSAMAAEAARYAARRELATMAATPPAQQKAVVATWCDGPARNFIRQIIEIHMIKHQAFDDLLRKAKH